jgi:Fe-S-cluster containining protein
LKVISTAAAGKAVIETDKYAAEKSTLSRSREPLKQSSIESAHLGVKRKLSAQVKDEFRSGYLQRIQETTFTEADLKNLREQIDQAYQGSEFCDGCGFCCLENVPMVRLEFERIRRLVEEKPELLRHQGYVCCFLDLDLASFDRYLKGYSQQRMPPEPSRCRIYSERPLPCRLYPPTVVDRCRSYGIVRPPDLVPVAEQNVSDQFPETLVQKYYVNLRREWLGSCDDPLDESELYQRVPGWILDPEHSRVLLLEGPHLQLRYQTIPVGFSFPNICELEDWEFEAMSVLDSPSSYSAILRLFSDRIEAKKIGTFLAQIELTNVIAPVRMAERMHLEKRSYWSFLRDLG